MTLRSRRVLQFWALLLAGAGCLAAQSTRPDDLAVGRILVSPRGSADPLFAESVILLVRYGETGALGLMVNRRTKVPISRALSEIEGAARHSDPVFVGGPVELGTVFALARDLRRPEGATEVIGNVYFIAPRTALEKELGGASNPNALRIYLGYCGWGPHQLEAEVRDGRWYIFNRGDALTFDAKPATLWSRLIVKTEERIARLGSGLPTR
ncbi:MAG TPA: YqgE/AlgH family protein [Candidatus Acidoferrales bacterium]|nr:YqgE/AlgH family protein [Candidatus Acidoferrales bacterium]